MKKTTAAAALAGALFLTALAPQAANAQTGDELRGQSVRVEFANGTVNTVNFGADGSAQASPPTAPRSAATGSSRVNSICLQTAAGRDAGQYGMAFQACVPVQMTSDCASTSTWTALSTAPLPPPPAGRRTRGRTRLRPRRVLKTSAFPRGSGNAD